MGRKINSARGRIDQREPDSEFSACGQPAEDHRSHGPIETRPRVLSPSLSFYQAASTPQLFLTLLCATIGGLALI